MADSDGSSSASSPASPGPKAVITEDDVRSMFPDEGGWAHNYWPYMMGPNTETLERLGALNNPAVLEGMLAERRWLDVAEYLETALKFHPEDAAAAVAYPADAPSPADMLRAHPELFVLPRRQHALELLADGEQEQAQRYFDDSIFAPTRLARRTRHLDAVLARLGDMIRGDVPLLDLDDERRTTARDIQDYLRVYFPNMYRGQEVAASIAASKNDLYTTAAFGEVIGGGKFRCLVCHQQLTLPTAPDYRFVEHLHDDCPAVTPAVRSRLPRRNRRPRLQPAPAAAGEPHGGGAAGGGAPDHHQVAPD
ncbi:hypothetical protein ACP70R_028515 [Stipagrostis hirtigluma subsp. patula]